MFYCFIDGNVSNKFLYLGIELFVTDIPLIFQHLLAFKCKLTALDLVTQ